MKSDLVFVCRDCCSTSLSFLLYVKGPACLVGYDSLNLIVSGIEGPDGCFEAAVLNSAHFVLFFFFIYLESTITFEPACTI